MSRKRIEKKKRIMYKKSMEKIKLVLISSFFLSLSLIAFLFSQQLSSPDKKTADKTDAYYRARKRYEQDSLHVRINKSLVYPGESYTLLVFKDKKTTLEPYSGYLDVGFNCDQAGNSCRNTSPWKGFDGKRIYVNNGSVTVYIPNNVRPFTVRDVRFRPSSNSIGWKWSNPLTVGVNQKNALVNIDEYYRPSSDRSYAILYEGKNYAYNNERTHCPLNNRFKSNCVIDFKTIAIFTKDKQRLGKISGFTVYILKSSRYGFWRPLAPWFEKFFNPNNDKPSEIYSRYDSALQWVVSNPRKKSNWLDLFLRGEGDVRYWIKGMFDDSVYQSLFTANGFNENNLVSEFNTVFSVDNIASGKIYLDDPNNPMPNYTLSAEYVGNGWGIGSLSANNKNFDPKAAINTSTPSNDSASSIIEQVFNYHNKIEDYILNEVENTSGNTLNTSQWAVHADIIPTMNVKGKRFDNVLRLRYYEGGRGFLSDNSKYVLREDWYFAKGEGLIKIEIKDFCPSKRENEWGSWVNCKPCTEDRDCLAPRMSSPHVVIEQVDKIPLNRL